MTNPEQGKPEPQPTVPDTPETLARWMWVHYVGIPLTEPYDKEYTRLFDRVEALNRKSFVAGLTEARRQFGAASQPLVPQQEPTNHMERGDAEWQYLVTLANAIRSQLDSKPSRLKLGTWGCNPGSVLNAYREGDLNFKEAVSRLRAGVPSEQGKPPQDMRITFEIQRFGFGPVAAERRGDTYYHSADQEAWKLWQAAWAAASQSTGWVSVEAVAATVCEYCAGKDGFNRVPRFGLASSDSWWHEGVSSNPRLSPPLALCKAEAIWALPTPPSGETT